MCRSNTFLVAMALLAVSYIFLARLENPVRGSVSNCFVYSWLLSFLVLKEIHKQWFISYQEATSWSARYLFSFMITIHKPDINLLGLRFWGVHGYCLIGIPIELLPITFFKDIVIYFWAWRIIHQSGIISLTICVMICTAASKCPSLGRAKCDVSNNTLVIMSILLNSIIYLRMPIIIWWK